MILTFDQVGEILDDLYDQFPPALFRALNGGVCLLPEAKPDPEFPPGEMYFMGEYCTDQMGCYINIYYGSFAALAEQEDWTAEDWEEELYLTLSHELTHHMEDLACESGLDRKDAAMLAEFRREFEEEGHQERF